MTVKLNDFVRAVNPKLGLPAGSVWVVVACAQWGVTLRPFNNPAEDAGRERLTDALDNPTPAPLPAGWGTSPRRAPTAATYKPAHGGYPGEVKA